MLIPLCRQVKTTRYIGKMKSSDEKKTLNIRFEILTTANDVTFKTELIHLISASIRELKPQARNAVKAGSREVFHQAAHKAKSSLTLINDADLFAAVERIKDLLSNGRTPDEVAADAILNFEIECDRIQLGLEDAKALLEMMPVETKH